MKYDKKPLTYEEQAGLILSRGLDANRDTLIQRLTVVHYYRLSGYLYPYRKPDDSYKDGTTLDLIWAHYLFDRKLRLLTMDVIGRIEIALRTQLAYHFSHDVGPFAYTDPKHLPQLSPEEHKEWLEKLKIQMNRSREEFMVHFNRKYGDEHSMPPAWMLVELMSMGALIKFYQGSNLELQKKVSAVFDVDRRVLKSWLHAMKLVRNICAHNGRLWNSQIDYHVLLPEGKSNAAWKKIESLRTKRIFMHLTALRFLLRTASPMSDWTIKLKGLFDENPDVSIVTMGFPEEWDMLFPWC